MSATAAIQAISLIVDLTTAASHMLASANSISAQIKASGGTLTDDQWTALRTEDLQLQTALAAAVNARRQRESTKG